MHIPPTYMTNAIQRFIQDPATFKNQPLEITKLNITQNEALDILLNILLFIGTFGLAHLANADAERNEKEQILDKAYASIIKKFVEAEPDHSGNIQIDIKIDKHPFSITIQGDGHFTISHEDKVQKDGQLEKPFAETQTHLRNHLVNDMKEMVSTLRSHLTGRQLLEGTPAKILNNKVTRLQELAAETQKNMGKLELSIHQKQLAINHCQSYMNRLHRQQGITPNSQRISDLKQQSKTLQAEIKQLQKTYREAHATLGQQQSQIKDAEAAVLKWQGLLHNLEQFEDLSWPELQKIMHTKAIDYDRNLYNVIASSYYKTQISDPDYSDSDFQADINEINDTLINSDPFIAAQSNEGEHGLLSQRTVFV